MVDDKNGRERQARNAERRQREREVAAALRRSDEPEPPVPEDAVNPVRADLDAVTFPATGEDVVAVVGDHEVPTEEGALPVADLIADPEEFDSLGAVEDRLRRPQVSTAMTRVVEAVSTVQGADFGSGRHEAFQRTFEELAAVDALDDDEGITAVADWILERVRETGRVPGSRDVRRQAATYCREHGYTVRDDEWLGV